MTAINEPAALESTSNSAIGAAAARRASWMRQVTSWHWISSAISLVGMLFFALTGITLNHAELLEASTARVTRQASTLPPVVLAALNAQADAADTPLPTELTEWLERNWKLVTYPKGIERSANEVFVDLKRPGVDVALTIDRQSGEITYEAADRGWIAWLNELHRGRNAGSVWGGFITVFGIACVIFSVTGLLILQVHARARWLVWPITGLGLVAPLLLVLLFIH